MGCDAAAFATLTARCDFDLWHPDSRI